MLANNIDASETENWDGGKGFHPIGNVTDPFIGYFDGNGYAISGLFIDRGAENQVGLFGNVGDNGTIIDLIIEDANITGKDYVGVLAGHNQGIISGCSATGDVEGIGSLGGLVGSNYGNVTESHATCNITGEDELGGLVGYNVGNISKSYATGNVSGIDAVGGLVGNSNWVSSIIESYATGNVKGTDWKAGGLVGSNFGVISKSYATGDTEGLDSVGGLVGSSSSQANINESYATGNVSGINIVGGLAGFNEGSLYLTYAKGDVDAEQRVGGLVGLNEGPINESFATGSVSATITLAGGLVGLSQLLGDITDSYATGNVSSSHLGGVAGGLVGEIEGVSLWGCYATGDIESTGTAGGLVGLTTDGTITYCYATGAVTSTGEDSACTGGLIGHSNGNVSYSFATGDVTGVRFVGGLIGFAMGNISNSFAIGNVVGSGIYTGGLIADVYDANIEDCYALGEVSGVENVGGLVGSMEITLLNRTYAAGKVDGTTDVGGLVGQNKSGQAVDSYWNNETSETDISAVGESWNATSMKLQATFGNWDFADVWWMAEGHTYPLLHNTHWAPVIVSDLPELPVYGEFIAGFEFSHTMVAEPQSTLYWNSDASFIDMDVEGNLSGLLEQGNFFIDVTPVSSMNIPGESQTITLVVSNKVLVTGSVEDPDGNPIVGVKFLINDEEMGESDEYGAFLFLIGPDDHVLEAQCEEWKFTSQDFTATTGNISDLGAIVAYKDSTGEQGVSTTVIVAGGVLAIIALAAIIMMRRS